ncbi:MAG: hypothetical protein ACRDI2_16250, partial [Chloroflexota bacterium]
MDRHQFSSATIRSKMARRLLAIGAALFAILAPAVARVAAAQEATQQVASCMPGDRSLTGAW